MRRLFIFLTMTVLLLTGCKKEDSNVVQSIKFTNVDNGRLTLLVGEDFRVRYTVEPASLQETAVLEWTSSKEDVASVRNGRISANEEGKATITATCGNATATISVEVEAVDVTDFKLPSSVSGYVGAPVKVDVTGIEPEGGSISSITWSMADESIATCHIDAGELYVTGVKQGTTKLIGEGLDVKRECSVTVKEYIPVQSVKVTLGKSSIGATSSTSVSLSVLPSNASVKDVRWTVSPSSYAEFDESSMTITAGTEPGTVTITATAVNDNVSGSAELTITQPTITGLEVIGSSKFPYNYICPDGSVTGYPKTVQLTAEITPSIAANGRKVTWKSFDTSRATVDENGLVTAKGHGAVMIQAECDGFKDDYIVVSWKKSEVQWMAYKSAYDPEVFTSIEKPSGWGFYIYDPAHFYVDDKGKTHIATTTVYRTESGWYNITYNVPQGIHIYVAEYMGVALLDYAPTCELTGTITADMGIGPKFSINVVHKVQSITARTSSGKELFTVAKGGTYTINRSSLPSISTVYHIYHNTYGSYSSQTSSWGGYYTCSNSSLISGGNLKLSSSTPKGTYTFNVSWPGELNLGPVSFTLVIQ